MLQLSLSEASFGTFLRIPRQRTAVRAMHDRTLVGQCARAFVRPFRSPVCARLQGDRLLSVSTARSPAARSRIEIFPPRDPEHAVSTPPHTGPPLRPSRQGNSPPTATQ